MAITTAIPTQAKQDLLDGVHAAADVYKMALYTSSASLDSTSTTYSATNEVVGTGYSAGGATLAGRANAASGTTAFLDFNDVSWAAATITARGCIIYNSSKSNKILGVFSFGASDISSTNGTFTVQMPNPDAANAIIRLA